MVTSVHLLKTGVLAAAGLRRRAPQPQEVDGLRWGAMCLLAPLGPSLVPSPRPGTVGLIAAWDEDDAIDAFLTEDPVGRRLGEAYEARLAPTRIVGEWPELGDFDLKPAGSGDETVAVLTLGRLKPSRGPSFLRASAKAEGDALASPGLMAATGLARPPRLVATFSIWRSVGEMRAYVEQSSGGHKLATTTHARRPFHSQSAFIRFSPYRETGEWPSV
jgi:hypothetical protein